MTDIKHMPGKENTKLIILIHPVLCVKNWWGRLMHFALGLQNDARPSHFTIYIFCPSLFGVIDS